MAPKACADGECGRVREWWGRRCGQMVAFCWVRRLEQSFQLLLHSFETEGSGYVMICRCQKCQIDSDTSLYDVRTFVQPTHAVLDVAPRQTAPSRPSRPPSSLPHCLHPRRLPLPTQPSHHPRLPRQSPPLVPVLVSLSRGLLPRWILCHLSPWPSESPIALSLLQSSSHTTDALLAHWPKRRPTGSNTGPFSLYCLLTLLTGSPHPWPLDPSHCLEGRCTCSRFPRLSGPPLW